MIFSKQIQGLQSDIPGILSIMIDDPKVRDVALLEPGQVSTEADVLYSGYDSGYEEQIKDGLLPPMCILGGKALPEGAEAGRCLAVVRRE